MKNDKLTVSLCMIVKNEEKVLAKCLESVKDGVDELIIVDTGSTDRTKEIAERFGAKVYDFKWTGDFSEARNFAKEKATSEWIIQLDADEYFEQGEAKKIKQEILKTDKPALTIKIANITDNHTVGITHIYFRIYKNLPDIWYENRIHEQVKQNGKDIGFDQTNLVIYHTGYMKEVAKEKNKRKRNFEILEKELADNPNSGYMNLNISNEYLIEKDYEKSLAYATVAFKNSHGSNYQSAAVMNIIKSLIHLDRKVEALDVIQKSKEAFADFTDILYYEGQIYEKMGRKSDAEQAYRKCILNGESGNLHMTQKGVGSIYPAERLALLSIKNGDYEVASEFANLLVSLNPHNKVGLQVNLKMIKRALGEEGVFNYIEKLFRGEDMETRKMKFQYLTETRSKKGILYYYPKMKEDEVLLGEMVHFYGNLLAGNMKEAKIYLNQMKKTKNEDLKIASILYGYCSDDTAFVEKLRRENKTAAVIFGALYQEEAVYKKKNYDVKLYIKLMKELMSLGFYEEVEKLLSIETCFDPIVYKKIGEIFYGNFNHEIAVEYYTKYLKFVGNDAEIYLLVSQILYLMEMYEDCAVFAQKANELDEENFQAIELYIEANEQLGNKEEVARIVEQALELFPESYYLNKKVGTI